MMVPGIGVRLKMLMPVGPEVTASARSAALPEMRLFTITLSLNTTGGAPAGTGPTPGAAWLCIVTPGWALLAGGLFRSAFAKSLFPGPAQNTPTPAPPFESETLSEMTLANKARSEEHTSELQSHSFISYAA